MVNILTETKEITEFKVDEHGIVYDKDLNIVKPEIIKTRKYKGKVKKLPHARLYIIIKYPDGIFHRKQLARWMLLSFKPIDHPEKYEANHIDGNSENNELSNLEWTTRKSNMKHAADNNLLPYGENHHNSKYPDKLIHWICQDIVNHIPRSVIMTKYKINGQLIDDIRAGRSHRKISRLYISKGFIYTKFDKSDAINIAVKICELIDAGLTNKEIAEKLNLLNICLPNDIRKGRVYIYISKKYNFYKEIEKLRDYPEKE